MTACASPCRKRTLEIPSVQPSKRRNNPVKERLATDHSDIGIGFCLLD